VQDSSDVTLSCLTEDWIPGRPGTRQDAIRAILPGGETFTSGPGRRAAMFKITP
jgi:hypothetical protein